MDEAAFWSRVAKSAGCWEWQGARAGDGYGRLRFEGRMVSAHRLAYELVNGPIPDGLFACHHCDNPPCVRFDHLFLGTSADNARDAVAKGRATGFTHPPPSPALRPLKTHCKNGHEFTPENTRIKEIGRACRECDVVRHRGTAGYQGRAHRRKFSPDGGDGEQQHGV